MKRFAGFLLLPLRQILFAALCMSLGAVSLLAQAPAPAEDPNTALYKAGLAAFEGGQFEAAAEKFSTLIRNVPEHPAAMEAAYFDVAVSYYNLQRYDDAARAFKDYRDKYPKGVRVNDATMSLANAYLGAKDYTAALDELQKLETVAAVREQVLFLRASIFFELKKNGDAIRPLEALTADGLHSSLSVRGALMLASLYVEKADFVKANALVANIQRNLALVDNILRFNGLIVELGDKLLEQSCYPQALALYHIARSRKEVIQYQKERIARIDRTIEENKSKFRTSKDASTLLPNQMLFSSSQESKRMLEEIEKAPSFEPALLIRVASAYQQNDRPQEASLVYQQIVDKYPPTIAEREPAMFGLIATLADSARQKRALEACETYLKTFPSGPNAGAVSYLRGAMALDAGEYTKAVSYFGTALQDQPSGAFADRMTFMTANAYFLAGDSKTALGSYEKYLSQFPSGASAEEAAYRIALCQMFSDQYEEAQKNFNAFVERYPQGEFTPDAKYRLAVITYAAQQYDQTIAACLEWIKQNPQGRALGEVYALLGDAKAATEKREEAADAYVSSYKAAMKENNDEVLNYSLFEAGKQFGKAAQWEKSAAMFEQFLKDHPEHSLAPAAVANIIQARSKMGQIDQAKAIAAKAAARFISDPSNEATENLLTQLAALCARRRQAGSDPAAELDKLLTFGSEVAETPTVAARRLFAKAELMTFIRKPKEHDDLIYQIAEKARPADLSPLLLGEVGEALMAHDRPLPAREMFEFLITKYPKSEVLDFGYVGLGELSFAAKDYDKALELFSKAIDDIPSSYRIKEATLGKAKTLVALGKLDEASKLFEQVASVKEWRGEATARSLVSLGDIENKRADYAKAIGYYQRVYVAWQKYPVWVARAYIESAHAFEKLGKNAEAVNTYKEMLRNERIANSDEVQEARRRLAEMGQG